jgi:LPXTG-motif cell wall-anchored protein
MAVVGYLRVSIIPTDDVDLTLVLFGVIIVSIAGVLIYLLGKRKKKSDSS